MKKHLISLLVLFLLLSTSFVGVSNQMTVNTNKSEKPIVSGLQNSPWPMYCHDAHHTGQSSFSTTNTTGEERWRLSMPNIVEGSPVIDTNGVIYIGCDYLYAVYPNGTIKWKYYAGSIYTAPVIDDNGIIYVGNVDWHHNYLFALYPNGTKKWTYYSGWNQIVSSPVIGSDETIYFGCEGMKPGEPTYGYITALYLNGTLRWQIRTPPMLYSSLAIGDDGTIYCGGAAAEDCLYALYPNNGTVKWKFGTDGWVRQAPCIADDGTIYCVSYYNSLFAINPNGTMKWKTDITDVGAGTASTIGQDGTIYAGHNYLYAINPINGAIEWTFNPGVNRSIQDATPCHSAEGTIYFGVNINEYYGGEIIAINPNGTEKWRKTISDGWIDSAPAIGKDGTIYIGSSWRHDCGYLHAFGPGEPKKIEIQQPKSGTLYLFGIGVVQTLLGKTIIIGSVNVKVHPYSEDEIENIHFSIDGIEQYNCTQPPFEWRLNQHYGKPFQLKHTLTVTASYKGGCEWSESIDIIYFHLLEN